jgi:hypothetical protein
MNSTVYEGKLAHARSKPKKNSFTYGVFMLYLDLDEIDDLDRKLRLFSRNRFNVFSFYDRDHFKFLRPKSRTADVISREHVDYDAAEYERLAGTRDRVAKMLREAGHDFPLGRICVLTNPRIFGYVFNPVSFYYCFDASGEFRVLLSEVNNTFGDQKMYVAEIGEPAGGLYESRRRKNFYISPFIDFDNELRWRFNLPGESVLVDIESSDAEGTELKAVFSGKRRGVSDRLLFGLVFRYPLLTLMIIWRIHHQALRLFLKGVRFRDKKIEDQKIRQEIEDN